MKKRNVMIGVGAGTAILAACAIVKGLFDHKYSNEGLNDQEAEKINNDKAKDTVDRGVDPIETINVPNKSENDDIPDLKADAINDGYKPIDY